MMEGYYSPHATVALEKPLALISFPGQEHRRAGHTLASRTGLGYVDLDRWIEHETGSTLKDFLASAGTPALRRLETEQLQRAFRNRPHGVIALSPDILMDPYNLDLVLDNSLLVVLHRNLEDAFQHLSGTAGQGPSSHPSLPPSFESVEALAPWYRARQGGYRRAHHVLDLSRLSASQVIADLHNLVLGLAKAS